MPSPPHPSGSGATLSPQQAAAIERARDSARRTSATIRAELLRRIPQAINEQEPVDPAPVDIDERLGELLIGSSAEAFSRLVGPEVFSVVAGLAVRHAFLSHVRDGGRTSWVTQAMQPGQFDPDTLHWAALESVLGRPFYTPADGSTDAPRAPRTAAGACPGGRAVVGHGWPRLRQRTPADGLDRCRRPAACRTRTGPRVR